MVTLGGGVIPRSYFVAKAKPSKFIAACGIHIVREFDLYNLLMYVTKGLGAFLSLFYIRSKFPKLGEERGRPYRNCVKKIETAGWLKVATRE